MRVRVHPVAWDDLRRYLRYLERQKAPSEIVDSLFAEVRVARKKIGQNPQTWSVVAGSRRVRKVQISRFGMQAVYTVGEDGIPLILEFVGRGARPRWRDRL